VWQKLRVLPHHGLSVSRAIESVIALPSRVFASEQDRSLRDAIPNALSTNLAQVEKLETKVPST
jgi:hypothetical protein